MFQIFILFVLFSISFLNIKNLNAQDNLVRLKQRSEAAFALQGKYEFDLSSKEFMEVAKRSSQLLRSKPSEAKQLTMLYTNSILSIAKNLNSEHKFQRSMVMLNALNASVYGNQLETEQKILCNIIKGDSYLGQNDFIKSFEQYQLGVDLCENIKESSSEYLLPTLLNKLGNCLLHQGNNKKSIEYYKNSIQYLEIPKTLSDESKFQLVEAEIGLINNYIDLLQLEDSVQILNKLDNIKPEKIEHSAQIAIQKYKFYNLMNNSKVASEQLSDFINSVHKSSNKNNWWLAEIYRLSAFQNSLEGKLDLALNHLGKSKLIYSHFLGVNHIYVADVFIESGKYLLQMDEISKAEKDLKEALLILDNQFIVPELSLFKVYLLLSYVNQLKGLEKESFLCLKKATLFYPKISNNLDLYWLLDYNILIGKQEIIAGEYDKAIKILNEIYEKTKTFKNIPVEHLVKIHLLLGAAYKIQGKTDLFQNEIKAAMKYNSKNSLADKFYNTLTFPSILGL